MVYSRLTNIFRAAGTVDIAGFSSYYKNGNLKFITKNIKQSFSNYGDINNSQYWQGLRPFRPNSLPLICQVSKYPNLLLNMGHGSLGLTLAAGSAKIISNIVNKNDIENYIRTMIRQDNSFVFEQLLIENYEKWINIKEYYYKECIYINYLMFLEFYIMDNESIKCKKILDELFVELGFNKNQHKKKSFKYIII
jgi:hypothetical protein